MRWDADWGLYVPNLPNADPRLCRRYHQLVMAHLPPVQLLAAGLRPPPSLKSPMSAAQAAWRFFSNDRLGLPDLAAPLLACAAADVPAACKSWVPVILDWCSLHFSGHASKRDRIALKGHGGRGYELLDALAISDRDGSPVAPLCFELRAADGIHTTRASRPLTALSVLDGLTPVLDHIAALGLARPPVFIIDREADSVAHYRAWDAGGHRFVIRANDARLIMHEEKQKRLGEVTAGLSFSLQGRVKYRGKTATQHVAQTRVVLHRPARSNRIDPATGRKKHRDIEGEPLPLRLVVSEVRGGGRVLARWLLLTNLVEVEAGEIAQWYYWRWRIETYHKLFKSAGQHMEGWQQETAGALARRMLVAAMSAVIVWRLAREEGEQADRMRELLVRLSGRLMKWGTKFTEPALMAGLGILLPMLDLMANFDLQDLQRLAKTTLPQLLQTQSPRASP
jgi:hypothetical protein